MPISAHPDRDRWSLYEDHAGAIRRFVARRVEEDVVEDLVAEVFAVAWRKRPREEDPVPWLYAVAGRVVYGHRRSFARRARLLAHVATHLRAEQPADPAELVVGDPVLARAFTMLKRIDREAICLVAWEGLPMATAARAAGCSEATFSVRFSRARTRLAALERVAKEQLILAPIEPTGHAALGETEPERACP